MAGETTLTIIGNLTDEPTTRTITGGQVVTSFNVASKPRVKGTDGQWKDGEALYLRASCWRELGEHAAQTLTKGSRVVVVGRLKQRSYETPSGQRTSYELDVEELGLSLKFDAYPDAKQGRDRPPRPVAAAPVHAGASAAAEDPWGAYDEAPF